MVQLPPQSEDDSLAEGPEAELEDVPVPEVLNRGQRIRRRILKSTALLPALFTVSHALCGFAAIHFATKEAIGQGGEKAMMNLTIACWLIVAAMVCDMLDGRLARMTRRTSDFGAQLDSLADVVSFGVAPAVLMVRTVVKALRDISGVADHAQYVTAERVVLCVAGIYVACAVLRLARFNVENEPDESAHMSFSGLPSPGAAAGIVALVLLLAHLLDQRWIAAGWLLYAASVVLPAVTLAGGLLMVSRVRYPHLVNQYIRGKKPFNYLVKLVVVAVAAMLQPLLTGAVLAVGYVLMGPTGAAWRAVRARTHRDAP